MHGHLNVKLFYSCKKKNGGRVRSHHNLSQETLAFNLLKHFFFLGLDDYQLETCSY